MKHEEADLHLKVCRELKKRHPNAMFIRHEREKQRTKFTGGLMSIYNSTGGIPDFELITPCGCYNGMYIEFKKPGEYWLDKDGFVKEEYSHQYECHIKLWAENRCAYFCNDYLTALLLIDQYIAGVPYTPQMYSFKPRKQDIAADEFFNQHKIRMFVYRLPGIYFYWVAAALPLLKF